VPLVEREVDDPGKLEAVAVDEVQFLADARAGGTGESREFLRVSGNEEAGVAGLQAELKADRFGALVADVLGDGACTNNPPATLILREATSIRTQLSAIDAF